MSERLKILQLVTKRQYRGAEVFAANLSKELIKLNHDLLFVGLYANKDEELIVEKAKNIDLAADKQGSFSLKIVMKLIKLVREYDPDVIQCNGSDTLKYMVAASFFLPKKPLFYRNISTMSEWFSSNFQVKIYKFLFSRIDHITSVGTNARKDLIKNFDIDPNKVSVVRRGIPFNKVESDSGSKVLYKKFGIESDSFVVIHVGNFSPEKNHEFLLEVFKEVKKVNQKIKLVCVGNGILFDNINNQIEKLNLNDTVYLLGFRKDIPDLMATSDLCILSSKVEGVPGVILEAAAQGIPSISVNVGGVKEVLVNEKTGIIIDAYDPLLFLSNILKLYGNRELLNDMGFNANKYVSEEFNPERNAKIFEELYLKYRINDVNYL